MRTKLPSPRTVRVTLAAAAALAGAVMMTAQNRMAFSPLAKDGHVALGLALRKLSVSGTFMQAPAHPDDETNALFAYFGYGMGLRVIDLQNNRGDGGQNEIGPELFRDIAILRTSELLAAHRIDGAEQYFTRAIDYGYSFDPNEVIDKWGRSEIVGDYVRLLRTLRPDVTVTMGIQGSGGDRAHEATSVLFQEAYKEAGDPTKYPEQIREEGLRPWQPKKLYLPGGRGAIPAGGFGGRGASGASGAQQAGGRGAAGRGGGRGAERGAGRGAQGATAATAAPPGPPMAPVNTQAYDPLLGRTYAEIGADARSYHKCQGIGGLPPIPGAAGGRGRGFGGGGGYILTGSTIPGQIGKKETSLYDGIDISLTSIASYAGNSTAAAAITADLNAVLADAKEAQKLFADGNDVATAAPVEAGLRGIRALMAKVPSLGMNADAQYEVNFRLRLKERDYEDAVLAANNVTFDALADDGLVIPGQPIRLSIVAMNHGAADLDVTSVDIAGFDSPAACKPATTKKDAPYSCTSEAHIPNNAKPTTPYFTDNYWKHADNLADQIFDPSVGFGLPFAPSPFRVTFHVNYGGMDITKELPIEYRYVKDIYFGDKRMELNVVPDFSVRVDPTLAVIPAPAGPAPKPATREIHVTVTNGTKGEAKATIALDLPQGWKAAPSSVPVSFTHEDEALTARFEVTAPAGVKVGAYTLRAVVTSPSTGDAKLTTGYKEIDYPHIERRQVIEPAETNLKVVDVKVTPNVKVGYIVGVGDQVPPALQQLGAKVSFIEPEEMAFGDLSKYDVIITGVRAYERRDDLRAYNRRLLDYVERGGTAIIQYNKMEFNQAEYGPWHARVSSNRITDEKAPVNLLVPNDQVFNFPNKVGPATWANWTQERGLYFLGEKDPKYVDLVAMTDPFKDNPGEKLGSLVEAKYGKGRWFYLGLGLWRQLPAGTDGAYQLLANLISPAKK
jgi:LmbE family N-acetylglucosaminyl deacetylase